jgi:hypothetical protein
MKRFRFNGLLFYAAMAFFLTSCSGNGSKETSTDTTATADTTAANTVAPETNTIITTPQNMMVIMHKVSNFEKWKSAYDEHDSARLAAGIHNYVIGRGMQDSNMVLVALKIDDVAKAKAFAKDPGLKKAMQKGGVMGMPVISFTTMVFQDTANIGSVPRSSNTLTVKDWDTWQKAFEDGKQERLDNGIAVRAYGYDVDNNKKVTLVTALTDTAKAFAYYKSDALKERRKASGVVGEPKRFLFNIVQRY